MTEEIYKVVKENVTGWCLPEKVEWFYKIYSELTSHAATGDKYPHEITAVETGVFYGMSAIAQGLIIKELGLKAKLYAIDAWSKDASVEGSNSDANNQWWSKLNYDEIYVTFLRHINNFNLDEVVVPMRIRSQAAHSLIPIGIDVFHQDSNHSKEVIIEEIQLYSPKMRQGGYWICDDFNWVEAVEGYAKMPEYGFELVHEHNKDGQSFAIYRKL